jgi:hypothetical protein
MPVNIETIGHVDHSVDENVDTMYKLMLNPKWRKLLAAYEVRVTESWTGRQGLGMNAELIRKSDRKKIADVRDDADGGQLSIRRVHNFGGQTTSMTPEYNEFLTAIIGLPKYDGLKVSEDMAITLLSDVFEIKRHIRRNVKNGIAFGYIRPDDRISQRDFPAGTTLDTARERITRYVPGAMLLADIFNEINEPL